MKYRIIGVIGKKHHGKDTIAHFISLKYGYKKISFADPLKKARHHIFGLTYEQLYGNLKETTDNYWKCTPRYLLQTVGTNLFRNQFDSNIWIYRMNQIFENNPIKNFVICDFRFQNEADLVKKRNGLLFKVNRPGQNNNDNHISETGIDAIKNYDILIPNSGSIFDLYQKIRLLSQVS